MAGMQSTMSGGGLWALDKSSSLGRVPSVSAARSGLDASQLSLPTGVGDSFSSAKVATALRGSAAQPSVLSTTASFHGSGISDLRSAVVSQQRQFDGFVDKVASLLAAMHAEMTHDLHGALEGHSSKRLEDLRKAGSELDCRLAEVSARLADLREAESRDCSVAKFKGEKERAEMREWFSREMQVISGHFMGEVQSLHDRVDKDVRGLQEHLSGGLQETQKRMTQQMKDLGSYLDGDMSSMSQRLHSLEGSALMTRDAEPAWHSAIEHACECLKEDLRGELLDGVCGELRARLTSLEERLVGRPGASLPALPGAGLDNQDIELRQGRDRLDRLEADSRKAEAALERIEEDLRRLRQSEAAAGDREVQLVEWQQRIEGRLDTGAAAEARTGLLEQWRKRAEERFERLSALQQQSGPSPATEQRMDTLSERIDSLTATVQQQARQSSAGSGQSLEMRLDEVAGRVDSLALTVAKLGTGQPSRDSHAREGHARDEATYSPRLFAGGCLGRDDAVVGHDWQADGQGRRAAPVGSGDQEARAAQLRAAVVTMVANLRKELEGNLAHAAEGFLRREAEQLSAELREARAEQLEEAAAPMIKKLQKELEAKLAKAAEGCARRESERLSAELREDFASRSVEVVAHHADNELEELRSGIEAALRDASSQSQRVEEELRAELEACSAQVQLSSQKLAEQLRHEIGAKTSQLHTTSQRLTDETCKLRHDLELQSTQAQSLSQKLATELRSEFKFFVEQTGGGSSKQEDAEGEARIVQKLSGDLKGELEACIAEKLAGDLRGEVEARFLEVRSSLQHLDQDLRKKAEEAATEKGEAVSAARSAASEAVAELSRQLEDRLTEKIGRCDAAAEGCERVARAAEGCTREIAEDLRAKLSQVGGRLVEVVGSSLRGCDAADSEVEADASAAVRELLGSPTPHLQTGDGQPSPGTPRMDTILTPLAAVARQRASLQGDMISELAGRLSQQEKEMEDLRSQNTSLREEVDSFKLERKVSRCLAGLERARDLFSVRGPDGKGAQDPATASAPSTPSTPPPQHLPGRFQRKTLSLDGTHPLPHAASEGELPIVRLRRASTADNSREASCEPHSLSFHEKKAFFEPSSPTCSATAACSGEYSPTLPGADGQ